MRVHNTAYLVESLGKREHRHNGDGSSLTKCGLEPISVIMIHGVATTVRASRPASHTSNGGNRSSTRFYVGPKDFPSGPLINGARVHLAKI